jgi:signal transduction histidine kinase
MLLFLSWITTPGRSIGLLAVWEKSVLNIGTPFEAWLGDIANLAHQRAHAEDFLQSAISALADIPWISGVEWHTKNASGLEGQRTHNHLEVDTGELRVQLFTERSFSSALLIHCRLLIQVLGHFYVAKQRENDEASEAHLRAIYETGARVTHDIKNLLQSLQPLASALQNVRDAEQEHRGFILMQRRLPEIAQRLKLALDKLQKPREQVRDFVQITTWWPALCARHDDPAIRFTAEIHDGDAQIPCECFDSVIDNLIDNARTKLAGNEAHQIEVRLGVSKSEVCCAVHDDGPHIPEVIARDLFQRPVSSASGLGIGLYQAARQAQRSGCTLALVENRDGLVRFELRYVPAAAQSN